MAGGINVICEGWYESKNEQEQKLDSTWSRGGVMIATKDTYWNMKCLDGLCLIIINDLSTCLVPH